MMTLISSSFEKLMVPGATIDRISGGLEFTEGPVWNSEQQHLLFSDIRGDSLYTWSEQGFDLFRRPSGQANGNTYDRQGRLITCEHKNRRVSRTLADGTVETLADNYEGKRLNSPNDVICSSAGDIYFTDPPYGLMQPDGSIKNGELDFFGVYRHSPGDGSLTLLIDDFIRPNGLLLSRDESQLFIADTELLHIRVFDIAPDGTLQNGRLFAELRYKDMEGRPDGMKMDTAGNLYVAGGVVGSVWVFDPAGKLIGLIEFPEGPANLAWGGKDLRTLFVTARTSVYRLPMNAVGAPVIGKF
jgi:sugar lactone lactonase YvrE